MENGLRFYLVLLEFDFDSGKLADWRCVRVCVWWVLFAEPFHRFGKTLLARVFYYFIHKFIKLDSKCFFLLYIALELFRADFLRTNRNFPSHVCIYVQSLNTKIVNRSNVWMMFRNKINISCMFHGGFFLKLINQSINELTN